MILLKVDLSVPTVPGSAVAADDTGNTQNTPVDSTVVPTVPTVPGKSIDIYNNPVCGVCIEGEATHTRTHTHQMGGVYFSDREREQNSGLQVVEGETRPGTTGNKNREQPGTVTGNAAQREPLPVTMWRNGLTKSEAIAVQAELSTTWRCNRGMDSAGWFVRCPWWQLVLDPDWVPANSDWGNEPIDTTSNDFVISFDGMVTA